MAQVSASTSAGDTPQQSGPRMDSGSDSVSMEVDLEDSGNEEILRADYNEEDDEEISQLLEDKLLFSDEEDDENSQDEEKKTPNDDPTAFDQHMRKYQLELSEHALQGKNVIICAPTGSGKTRVALYIVRKHLQQAASWKERKGRVVFMARTVPLAIQQYKGFKKHLPEYRTQRICGDTELKTEFHMLLTSFDIFVVTPQVLVNHLEQKKLGSLSETFSLLLLDECHHTRKGEAYNRVMQVYLKEKLKDRRPELPQVVGLTASVGVGKSKNEAEAEEAIIKLMANMDVLAFATVQQHKEELQKLVPVPAEKKEVMSKRGRDPAKDEIEKVMQKLEEKLIDKYDGFQDDKLENLMWKIPKARDGLLYRQWVASVTDAVRKLQVDSADLRNLPLEFGCITEHLTAYNTALQINEQVRVKDALQYLRKRLAPQRSNTSSPEIEKDMLKEFTELQKTLLKMRDNPDLDNPKLDFLQKTLATMVREKGQDSRVIIFVSTRATCRALADWINTDVAAKELAGIKAKPFLGSGHTKDEEGMTQREQESVLSEFRTGDVRLLVATSVAEEGLDIPECNIVIRYDHVGNEISAIQTRGRARKKGGVSLLLGHSGNHYKEQLNWFRIAMMDRVLTKVQTLPESELRARIEAKQEKALEKEEIRELVRKTKSSNKREGDFKVICCKCHKDVACNSDMARTPENHHVVIGKQFLKQVDVRPMKRGAFKLLEGELICKGHDGKGCNNKLGHILRHEKVAFPALRVAGLIFVHDGSDGDSGLTGQTTYTKWPDIPYYIEDIGIEHFRIQIEQNGGKN